MPDFDYGVATAADVDEIIDLVARVFSESEPPAVAMGLTFADMKQFLRLVAPEIVSASLTPIARDNNSGELAGALLTGDFTVSPSLDQTRISPRFVPIFSMLEELDEQFRSERRPSPGECLHLFMLAVESRFAGAGIAKAMVAACLANGVRKGYRVAVTEATGNISQHVFRRQGFQERFKVAYRDFRCAGKAVFAGITEHEGALLMEKSIP